jgi:hypothetical protein
MRSSALWPVVVDRVIARDLRRATAVGVQVSRVVPRRWWSSGEGVVVLGAVGVSLAVDDVVE